MNSRNLLNCLNGAITSKTSNSLCKINYKVNNLLGSGLLQNLDHMIRFIFKRGMDNIKVFYLFAPFTLNMVNMIRKEFKQIKRA